jgi:hypothetical protein
MAATSYLNFDIQIIRVDGGYLAVTQGPDGRRSQSNFVLPFGEFQVKYYVSEATRSPQEARRGAAAKPDLAAKELGSGLFNTLFAGAVRGQMEVALDQRAAGQNLRIRLDLQGAPELATLPWEYLFHPDRKFFLALSPDTAFVRYIQVPEPILPLQVDPPLRILAMACSPEGWAKLDLPLERQRLQDGLSNLLKAGMVEIDWLPENSLAAVNQALLAKQYHIFHFVGHGAYVEEGDASEGMLVFEDTNGQPTYVTAEKLGWILRRSVKLAVINACESARSDAADPSAGVASSLLLQGIPAVVAMQFEISDAAAVQFAYDFYGAIAAGLPVDAAVTSARRDVMARFNNNAEWATPVLFMRSTDGQIFKVGSLQPADAETERQRREVMETLVKNVAFENELTRLQTWFGQNASPSLGRFAGWVSNRLPPRSPTNTEPGTVEEMYNQALSLMKEERWEDANRLFRRINEMKPGYRDIAGYWHEGERQADLAKRYRHLISNYAERNWGKVLGDCEGIWAMAPGYKDTQRYYADAIRMIRPAQATGPRPDTAPGSRPVSAVPQPVSQPKPSVPPGNLPAAPPAAKPPTMPHNAPASSRPPTLPGVSAAQQKPPTLPGTSVSPKPKPDKPPNLPG